MCLDTIFKYKQVEIGQILTRYQTYLVRPGYKYLMQRKAPSQKI